jgi:hypothetical protein
MPKKNNGIYTFVLLLIIFICAITFYFNNQHGSVKYKRLLLAPMFNVFDPCSDLEADPASVGNCNQPGGSAAQLVENTLSKFGPTIDPNGRFELGYTLHIPLLRLFKRENAEWVIDQSSVERIVRTLHDSNRPAVVYLFSTHFGVNSPIETDLAGDPSNLAVTMAGPLSRDKYYDHDIFPWTFATTNNNLTRRRAQAIDAVVEEICRLPKSDRDKIRGITMLGELHHLFPNFQGGMGFQDKYLITDYSQASIADFRSFVEARYHWVFALNNSLGSTYKSFAEVDPPSKDIRTQPLTRFTEHIDSYAHGSVPIAGWLYVPTGAQRAQPWVRLYLDGEFVERLPANLSRQDVRDANPGFSTADVGWRFDLKFSDLPSGIHRVDVLFEERPDHWVNLGSRDISVMERNQATPRILPQKELPPAVPPGLNLRWSMDYPVNLTSYYYNPLVPLWHEFRNSQVVNYLSYVDKRVRRSCLKDTKTYVHQLIPFPNPSWDFNKFAVDASLKPLGDIHLGVSLYGEATYGSSFFDWYSKSKHTSYGVTEFHPLRPLSLELARQMFEKHRTSNAQFLSFFLKTQKMKEELSGAAYQFAFDPDNPAFGSDQLHSTVKTLINEPAPRLPNR